MECPLLVLTVHLKFSTTVKQKMWKVFLKGCNNWEYLQRHYNDVLIESDGVSNHKRLEGLLNRLLRRRSKKSSELRVTGLCEGNSPVTGEFPAKRTSNAEKVSIWWRHHGSTLPICNNTHTLTAMLMPRKLLLATAPSYLYQGTETITQSHKMHGIHKTQGMTM